MRNGVTGLLRESGDVRGLADDVIRLLRDDEMRQTFGFRAKEHVVGAFSWAELAKRLEAGYTLAKSR